MEIINVTNLTKSFNGVTVVNNINFKVMKGDVYGILGPNGAGKTTTISMILSLLKPTDGTITVLNEKVDVGSNSVLKNVGSLIGDGPAYIPYYTGRENLAYRAQRFGIEINKVDEVLEFLGIAYAADKKPDEYSTGMKQRLGIAMAIVHQPKILILDEPTNGMDPAGIKEVRELIKSLSKRGLTIVLCSHLLHEVEQVCNKVAIFDKGHLLAEKNIDSLVSKEKTILINTNYIEQTVSYLKSKHGIHATINQNIIELKGIASDKLIEELVRVSLLPNEIYLKERNLEDLYFEVTNKEK